MSKKSNTAAADAVTMPGLMLSGEEMQVTCLQVDLARGLGVVSRAVAARSTLPVLGNILIATEESRLKLAATNLEIAIICWIGAKVHVAGMTTVPARTFVDLINALPQGLIEMGLTPKTQTTTLKCGRFSNNLKGVDAQEFPMLPVPGADEANHIAPDDLRRVLGQVVYAAATDESRPILTGVLVRLSGKMLTLAAADGFRLAVSSVPIEAEVPESVEMIVPARALAELSRISGEQTDLVAFESTRTQLAVDLTNVRLVSQLIDGQFPPYEQIVPNKSETWITVNRSQLLKAVKAANVFAREAAHIMHLKFVAADEVNPAKVELGATSAETGDNAGEIEATLDGPAGEIALNTVYLTEALNALETEQVRLGYNGPASPIVIKAADDSPAVAVIMPMSIGGR